MTLGDLNVLIAIGSLLVGIVGTAFAMWRWQAVAIKAVETAVDIKIAVLEARLALAVAQLGEFKVEVAKHYVSVERLQPLEMKVERLIDRIDVLATTLSRLVGRMEQDRAGGT